MRFLLISVALLLSACAPSARQVETAIAQTQAAAPTATTEPSATARPSATLTATVVPTATQPSPTATAEYCNHDEAFAYDVDALQQMQALTGGLGKVVDATSATGMLAGYSTILDAMAAVHELTPPPCAEDAHNALVDFSLAAAIAGDSFISFSPNKVDDFEAAIEAGNTAVAAFAAFEKEAGID